MDELTEGTKGAKEAIDVVANVANWQSDCVNGLSAMAESGCLVDTSSPHYIKLDLILGGASDYLSIKRTPNCCGADDQK